jgi:hypothetical protein
MPAPAVALITYPPAPAPGRKETAIIFDLDGTLNVCQSVSKFDWNDVEGCERLMLGHSPEPRMIGLLNTLFRHTNDNVRFIIATGRPAQYFGVTVQWLNRYSVKHHDIMMRETGDERSDHEVKRDMLNHIRSKYDVWFVVEDRASVTAMWRDEGVLCLQCAVGDY